jgi:hypothetical protein
MNTQQEANHHGNQNSWLSLEFSGNGIVRFKMNAAGLILDKVIRFFSIYPIVLAMLWSWDLLSL